MGIGFFLEGGHGKQPRGTYLEICPILNQKDGVSTPTMGQPQSFFSAGKIQKVFLSMSSYVSKYLKMSLIQNPKFHVIPLSYPSPKNINHCAMEGIFLSRGQCDNSFLHGQILRLHGPLLAPVHFSPLPLLGTIMVLVCKPLPQLFVHSDQADHWQSTET